MSVLIIFITLFFTWIPGGHMKGSVTHSPSRSSSLAGEGVGINICVVACGESKKEEAVTLVKSAILFSQHTRIHVYLFTDIETTSFFNMHMTKLSKDADWFTYKIIPASFPTEIPGMHPWAQIYKPCAVQRLFLSSVLSDVDSVIYLDADTLFTGNVSGIWSEFMAMDQSQLIGLSTVTEYPTKSWHVNRDIPNYGDAGVNSGVMLMNLTRMRRIKFEESIKEVRMRYESVRPRMSGDQYFLNILLGMHPEWVHVLPCEWNFRGLYCQCGRSGYGGNKFIQQLGENCMCTSVQTEGVGVIHGTGNVFTLKHPLPIFRHIYELFKTYSLREDNLKSLLVKLKDQFEMEQHTCGFNSSKIIYKKYEEYMTSLEKRVC